MMPYYQVVPAGQSRLSYYLYSGYNINYERYVQLNLHQRADRTDTWHVYSTICMWKNVCMDT